MLILGLHDEMSFSGPVVGEILDSIIPMMVENLCPDKDAEVRLKFFNLLSKLMLNAGSTLNSQNRYYKQGVNQWI